MKKITKSDKETVKLGNEFAKKLKPGDVIFLFGDLGFGKTTFTKGIAEGLGIKERIISPTFTIIREHKVKIQNSKGKNEIKKSTPTKSGSVIMKMFHVDLYRVENEKQLKEIGISEIINNRSSIVIVEWPEKLPEKKPNWSIYFEMNKDNTRTINIINHE